MNSIFRRRSIRTFTEQSIDDKQIENILRAGMQAPSAHNFQPWEFMVIRKPETKDAIANISPHAKLAAKADTLIVVLANMNQVVKENLWWQQDMGACTQNMLIQVAEEGLGGVWLGFYPVQERVEGIQVLFELSEHLVPYSVIAVGHSERQNEYVDRYDREKVHFETYHV